MISIILPLLAIIVFQFSIILRQAKTTKNIIRGYHSLIEKQKAQYYRELINPLKKRIEELECKLKMISK